MPQAAKGCDEVKCTGSILLPACHQDGDSTFDFNQQELATWQFFVISVLSLWLKLNYAKLLGR